MNLRNVLIVAVLSVAATMVLRALGLSPLWAMLIGPAVVGIITGMFLPVWRRR